MKNLFYSLLLVFFISSSTKAALYQTPGTGVNWTLADLVANSGGSVTFDGTQYLFIDSVTVNTGDIIRIENDATVKFNPKVVFKVNGTIIINPPNNVLFSAAISGTSFRGLWLENSVGSSINNLTYEYASSLRLSDCSPGISNSILRYNTDSTVLSSSALSLFRSSPVITNCQFINNYRPAIIGAPNIENAPEIIGCTFIGNNTMNLNNAQIVLGASGSDTSKIIGCTIINPGGIRAGGITVTTQGLGIAHAVIHANNISGNRYGVNLSGGADLNVKVTYNYIADNNIENNPNLGGSGIAFGGGSSTSHQNTIVTGNIFQNNLWGITILRLSGSTPISGAMPNLGNLTNADTSDDGKNRFINNTNGTTPGVDLYNNTSDPIFAQGNYWNTNIPSEVEAKIFHQFDNIALGLVNYDNFIVPVSLVSFNAVKSNDDANLSWQTAQELNSYRFIIEKSYDGNSFETIAFVNAAGNSSNMLNYNYTDRRAHPMGGNVYYRLKITDIDGSFVYSDIKVLSFSASNSNYISVVAPTIVTASQQISIDIASASSQQLHLQMVDALGRIIHTERLNVQQGFNRLQVTTPAHLKKGALFIKVKGKAFNETIRLIAQ